MMWLGDYPEDFTTVAVYFTTHDTTGAPVAPLSAFEADDVKIYKDGNAGQKATTNGLTMTSPFDSIVGLHRLLIDTSVDTGDTGFWVGGHVYTVVLNPDTETVNGITALKVVGTFGLALAANGGTGAPSAATIADAVWDEDATGHQTQGTFGQAIGDPGSDSDTIWALANTNLNATVSSRATQTSVDTVDSEVGDIKAKTDQLTFTTTNRVDSQVFGMQAGTVTASAIATAAVDADAVATDAAQEIADALLDRSAGIETGMTLRQALRIMLAALAGKASGLETTTAIYRDTNDSKDRITATVDEDGNRSAVTLDAS